MLSVANQLDRDILSLKGGADHPRPAVVKRGHCVKQMGDMGSSRVEGPDRFLIGCLRMRHGNPAMPGYGTDKLCGSGKLGSDIHNTDKPSGRLLQPKEGFVVRFSQICAVLCSLFRLR